MSQTIEDDDDVYQTMSRVESEYRSNSALKRRSRRNRAQTAKASRTLIHEDDHTIHQEINMLDESTRSKSKKRRIKVKRNKRNLMHTILGSNFFIDKTRSAKKMANHERSSQGNTTNPTSNNSRAKRKRQRTASSLRAAHTQYSVPPF